MLNRLIKLDAPVRPHLQAIAPIILRRIDELLAAGAEGAQAVGTIWRTVFRMARLDPQSACARFSCAATGKTHRRMACARCSVGYCVRRLAGIRADLESRAHQTADWPFHKRFCTIISTA